MLTEKDTIKCESVFNDERTHRFMWRRTWNKDKPLAAVVMLNPSQADNLISDNTSTLVTNHIASMEDFGGVVVVNLFSRLTNKLNFRWNSDEDLNDPDNDRYIKRAADECSTVILAWGKGADTNQRIAARVSQVLTLLHEHESKLFLLSDGERVGLHPLTPSLRSQWILKPFEYPVESSTQKTEAVE